MSEVIFCDESGITGNNLLDAQQPYFAFATVNMSSEEAGDLVAQIIRDYGLSCKELKGGRIIKSPAGRKAILSLIEQCIDRAKLVFYDKKSSLAGKFYQYTFDVVLGDSSPMFYFIDFNRFIANALLVGLLAEDPLAVAAINDFQSLMRKKNTESTANNIFSLNDANPVANLIETIILFCRLHKDEILSELNPVLLEPSEGKWLLELSYSALYDLLSYWGNRFDSIQVYCDSSKSISDQLGDFAQWVGSHETIEVNLGRAGGTIGFNLAQPISIVDSDKHPGIQIADVFASSLCYSLNHKDDPYCRDLFQSLIPAMSERCIGPEMDEIDLRKLKPYVNSAVLWQLVDRSCRGESISEFCDRLAEFLIEARDSYPQYRSSLTKEVLDFKMPGATLS